MRSTLEQPDGHASMDVSPSATGGALNDPAIAGTANTLPARTPGDDVDNRFTLFPKFPPEVRNKIWYVESFSKRVVAIISQHPTRLFHLNTMYSKEDRLT